jgi:hypothetical protein
MPAQNSDNLKEDQLGCRHRNGIGKREDEMNARAEII